MFWFAAFFFFSSRRRHTRYWRDWSSDVCSSDLELGDAVKIAAVAMVLTVRELPVRLLPVIGEIEGATDPDIGKQRPAQVERVTLHPPRTRIRELFLDDALFALGRKIVGRRPLLAAALGKPVQLIRLESLAPNRIVAKEFKPKLVEIIL